MRMRTLVAVGLLSAVAFPSATLAQEAELSWMTVILDNLRVEPLNDGICYLYERVAAGDRLAQTISEQPQILQRLKTTNEEVKALRVAEAKRLAASITQILQRGFGRGGPCSYSERLTETAVQSFSELDSNDDYELILALRHLRQVWGWDLFDHEVVIFGKSETDEALQRFVRTEGPGLVASWIKLQPNIVRPPYRREVVTLWRLLAQDQVSPSLFPGLTPQLFYELFKLFGRGGFGGRDFQPYTPYRLPIFPNQQTGGRILD